MAFFDLTEQEDRSFSGGVIRHTVLAGPLKLMRFSDSDRGHQGGYGSFWMYGSEVEEILGSAMESGPYGLSVIREISERWAICDDWGDLGRAWIMKIPPGGSLNAYFGFAKFQPKISTKAQRQSGRTTTNSYPGGSVQLVIRVTDAEKAWITGPYRTIDLSLNKIK